MLCSASAIHYRSCLLTIRMKILQSARFVRFSTWTDFWYAFNWSISNLNDLFIKCIQSSGYQGYDSTLQIMGRRHQMRGTVAETQNGVKGVAVN